MSRIKLLMDVVEDMRSLANSLQAVADALVQDEPETDSAGKKEEVPKKNAEKKAEAKKLTLEDVRAVLATKSREGHTAEVKELLKKHGANKLSEIDPANYEALAADAEAL